MGPAVRFVVVIIAVFALVVVCLVKSFFSLEERQREISSGSMEKFNIFKA